MLELCYYSYRTPCIVDFSGRCTVAPRRRATSHIIQYLVLSGAGGLVHFLRVASPVNNGCTLSFQCYFPTEFTLLNRKDSLLKIKFASAMFAKFCVYQDRFCTMRTFFLNSTICWFSCYYWLR